jgi:hypothetical protein
MTPKQMQAKGMSVNAAGVVDYQGLLSLSRSLDGFNHKRMSRAAGPGHQTWMRSLS